MKKTHIKIAEVYMTEDYSYFKKMEHNRHVSEAHIHKLMASMSAKQYPVPIIINEKCEVADGQNRLEGIKNLSLPVYYMKIDGLGVEDVKRLNQTNKTWKEQDYAESFASEGLNDYKRYLTFKREFGFGHILSLTLLADHTDDKRFVNEMFYEGIIEIKDYELARINAKRLRVCREFYDGWKNRSFVHAMLRLFKTDIYDHDHFMKKLRQKPVELIRNLRLIRNVVDANRAIEDIYNYKVRSGKETRLY